jgi:Ser/Thr protein kinase RdoA (MazF antagonist)
MTNPSDTSSLDIIAGVINHHYALGRVDRPEPLPGSHQRRHRKLLVNTAVGKFVAKTYKRDPYILDALRFQHRLSDHLLKHGLPVAKIHPAANGKRIVEVDDWALELQEFVEGAPMEVSKETLIISGQALGRFHEVCRAFPRPDRDTLMWRFSEVPREVFAGLYQRAREEGDPEVVDSQCNTIALFLREAAGELSVAKRDVFETGLIHGDWHGGNLLFRDGRLTGILDLEFAGDGCYLEDLAYAVSNLCIRTTDRPERLERRTRHLLHSYQHHRTLSIFEEIALYYAVGIKHVMTVAYQLPQLGGRVGGLSAPEWMGRLAFQCGWLHDRAIDVRSGNRL